MSSNRVRITVFKTVDEGSSPYAPAYIHNMKYVPEELYLNWQNRALVSRQYALSLEKDYAYLKEVAIKLQFDKWALNNEIRDLKRQPCGKLYKKLLKARQRISALRPKSVVKTPSVTGLGAKFLTQEEQERFLKLYPKYPRVPYLLFSLASKRANSVTNNIINQNH